MIYTFCFTGDSQPYTLKSLSVKMTLMILLLPAKNLTLPV